MRKILMMFIVTVIVFCTGCAAQNQTVKIGSKEEFCENLINIGVETDKIFNEVIHYRQAGALLYNPHGVYNLTGYNSKVYTFDAPNDFYEVVMMNDVSEDYIFIIHNTGVRGVSFQTIVYKNGVFCGLTSEHALFKEVDGSITAVSIEEKEHCEIGEYCHYVKKFEELTEEEQESAIYPNGYYWCEF